MELFYKKYNEYPVEIPSNSILLRSVDDYALRSNYVSYPMPFCIEVDAINRININDEGLFDFSKSIVDVGANLGEYCWLSNFAHAYAFEPNKESVYAMCANVLLHDRVNRTDIFECLLSDKEGMIPFNGFNSLDVTDDTPRVKSRTLDSFNLCNVGLIKIDVEMHEYEVLCGARETIERNGFPPIIFECFDVGVFGMTEERYSETFGFLEDYGYTIRKGWADTNTHLAVRE